MAIRCDLIDQKLVYGGSDGTAWIHREGIPHVEKLLDRLLEHRFVLPFSMMFKGQFWAHPFATMFSFA
ncbi:hypothetical protein WJ47_16710 [Burkholderia ubonensis]|uniref:Uncharacterized protein n=1 Tax=Burkholderia ubonensis TaxID=101571 RepID=A0AB73FUE3_9BURK|nr:hypothetical protein WJ44_19885 [Burkholderia ubonensis]KVL62236.1 hypothetical protein WJ47_16710 [Burkholderia ubonensis]KVM22003.1 hypothetical protein WJ53_19280 [Burkholderia ubonensis]KVM33591.1 hypothetical protein WJ54_06615 [Burkholderia ubonensis]